MRAGAIIGGVVMGGDQLAGELAEIAGGMQRTPLRDPRFGVAAGELVEGGVELDGVRDQVGIGLDQVLRARRHRCRDGDARCGLHRSPDPGGQLPPADHVGLGLDIDRP